MRARTSAGLYVSSACEHPPVVLNPYRLNQPVGCAGQCGELGLVVRDMGSSSDSTTNVLCDVGPCPSPLWASVPKPVQETDARRPQSAFLLRHSGYRVLSAPTVGSKDLIRGAHLCCYCVYQ